MQVQTYQNEILLGSRYRFSKRHCLGEGSYGKVFEGVDIVTKDTVAVKAIDQEALKDDSYLQSAIIAEADILRRFNHKNIVGFKDIFKLDGTIYIVTEFCGGGDLKEYLKKRQKLAESEVIDIFKQILNGIRELHQVGVIHRDLKPANILIHEGNFKIADFGFAKTVSYATDDRLLVSCVGSPMYMDPLILSRKPYGTKCDIWSLGIILFEILQGSPPFSRSRTEQELLINIYSKQIVFENAKGKVSIQLQQLIMRMLTIDESARISWEELFAFFGLKEKDPSEESWSVSRVQELFDDLMLTREWVNFRHYVVVDLLEKYDMNKYYLSKDNSYEKLLFLLGLSVKRSSEKGIANITQLEAAKSDIIRDNQNLLALSNSIRRECSYSQIVFDDIYQKLNLTGVLNSISGDNQVSPYLKDNFSLTDFDFEKLTLAIGYFARLTVSEILIETSIQNYKPLFASTNNLFSLMETAHYILDLLEVHELMKNNQHEAIDFGSIHQTKVQDQSESNYFIFLQAKLKMFVQ